MSIVEINRLLMNLIRVGVVTEVDYFQKSARVMTGNLVTDWIRWAVTRAGDAQTWWAPSVGEQVVILSPGGRLENAFIAFSLYSNDYVPPDLSQQSHVTQYPDGARDSYDAEQSAWRKTGAVSGFVEMGELQLNLSRLVLNVDQTIINGEVVQSGGIMSSNSIVVDSHIHEKVKSGSDTSGGPL